eukprot:4093180-Prymnesium_polylepis.1
MAVSSLVGHVSSPKLACVVPNMACVVPNMACVVPNMAGRSAGARRCDRASHLLGPRWRHGPLHPPG